MEIKAGRLPEGWDENLDRLQQKDLDARWNKRMASVTTVRRTVFASMLSMASSIDMRLPLPMSTTARCFHFCLIQKTSTTMSGQILVFIRLGIQTIKIGLESNEAWWGLKILTFNFLRFLQRSAHVAVIA